MVSEQRMTVAHAMALGVSHQQAGRLREAEAAYRAILETRPDHPGANHNLGLIALAAGHPQDACVWIARAIAAAPDQAIFRNSLGEALSASGRLQEARVAYGEAIRLAPSDPVPHNNLGLALIRIGRKEDGLAQLFKALKYNPRYEKALHNVIAHGDPDAARRALEGYLAAGEDAVGARTQLAALGFAEPPLRAPAAHMERLYQARAATWSHGAGYKAPELVARALTARIGAPVDLLDAGCGTGLVGPLVRPIARRLVGVDISDAMLGVARAGGVYDDLRQEDLVEHLLRNPASYDAIASAATLIHFGDLSPVFCAAAGALRGGGLFAFTVFPRLTNDDGYAVEALDAAQGGLFFHGRGYIEETALGEGLELVSMTDEVHESKNHEPFYGLLVICRRS